MIGAGLEVAAAMSPGGLITAFVQGARWWEYEQSKATMWASDERKAEAEAQCRLENGTLGKL